MKASYRYQRRVDGLVLPVSVAGEPALDFCNTRAGWGTAAPREYLATYAHLVVWAREAELVAGAVAKRLRREAERNPTAASRVLERALALRTAIYASCTEPGADGAWGAVAAAAREASAAAVLVRRAAPGRRWVIPETAGLEVPLLELARAAGAFLGAVDLRTVGRCPGEDCGWLFLTRGGRRRWCTMAVCGNRAKVRRHAARARQGRSRHANRS